jgi:hypothetical protein
MHNELIFSKYFYERFHRILEDIKVSQDMKGLDKILDFLKNLEETDVQLSKFDNVLNVELEGETIYLVKIDEYRLLAKEKENIIKFMSIYNIKLALLEEFLEESIVEQHIEEIYSLRKENDILRRKRDSFKKKEEQVGYEYA